MHYYLVPLPVVPVLSRRQNGSECPTHALDLAQSRLQLAGDVSGSSLNTGRGDQLFTNPLDPSGTERPLIAHGARGGLGQAAEMRMTHNGLEDRRKAGHLSIYSPEPFHVLVDAAYETSAVHVCRHVGGRRCKC